MNVVVLIVCRPLDRISAIRSAVRPIVEFRFIAVDCNQTLIHVKHEVAVKKGLSYSLMYVYICYGPTSCLEI